MFNVSVFEVWAFILLGLTQVWLLYDLDNSLSYLVNNDEVQSSMTPRLAVYSVAFCVWTGLVVMFLYFYKN